MGSVDYYELLEDPVGTPVLIGSAWTYTVTNTNTPTGWYHIGSDWFTPFETPRLRHGRWLKAADRRDLDALDGRRAVAVKSRQDGARAARRTKRTVQCRPAVVCRQQPAWSARRWKSLT